MAEPYATVDDYTKQTGTSLSVAGTAQVESLLVIASAIIRGVMPTGYSPDPDVAGGIAVQMVQRRITNPGGRRSQQVGQTQETYDQDGGLYLSDAERDQLLAGYNADDTEAQAYTIRLRDEAYLPGPYDCRAW